MTTGAIRRAKLESNVSSKKPRPSFTGRMPFLSPKKTQQHQSIEGKKKQLI